jgi:proteic killer suppression protein
MIVSYGDRDVKALYENYSCPKWLSRKLLERAYAKLYILDAAHTENDLRSPPSNHYEHLKGKKKDYSSIRINDQWRVVFRWDDGNAYDVFIEDYHGRKK